mgnify:CR=1 FL=1
MKKRSKKRNFDVGGLTGLIPAQVRTFVGTLAGNRDPITEKDFTPEELAQARKAINNSYKRQLRDVNFSPDTAKYKNYEGLTKLGILDPTVGYADYSRKGSRTPATDSSVAPSAAMRNTLGRFKYEKTPEGRLVATDTYDFKDDLSGGKYPNIPKTQDYEGLSTLGKIGKLATDTFKSGVGGIATLPSRAGNAFIGKDGRPVRIDLGEADFKKGGRVNSKKSKSATTVKKSSPRGDGLAKRGHTKGRMV